MVVEPGGDPVVAEDGRAVELPAGIGFLEATGVVAGGVESSPEDGAQR
jgi:hypothetical protein